MDSSVWTQHGPVMLGAATLLLAVFVFLDLPALFAHLGIAVAAYAALRGWLPRGVGFLVANVAGIVAGLGLRALLGRRSTPGTAQPRQQESDSKEPPAA